MESPKSRKGPKEWIADSRRIAIKIQFSLPVSCHPKIDRRRHYAWGFEWILMRSVDGSMIVRSYHIQWAFPIDICQCFVGTNDNSTGRALGRGPSGQEHRRADSEEDVYCLYRETNCCSQFGGRRESLRFTLACQEMLLSVQEING